MKHAYNLSEMYRTHYQDVYHYLQYMGVSSCDVEDVVQNSFLKAFRAIGRFRGDSNLKTWLLSIARNEAINYFQKDVRTASYEEMEQQADTVYLEDLVCDRESRAAILAFVAAREEPKRSLLVLRLLDELSFPEIAVLLGKSEVWCRVTYMRLKNSLLERLEDDR